MHRREAASQDIVQRYGRRGLYIKAKAIRLAYHQHFSLSLISFPRLTRHGQHFLSNISVQFPMFERRWELVTFLVLKPNSSDPREALDQLVRLGG